MALLDPGGEREVRLKTKRGGSYRYRAGEYPNLCYKL
jgi:hypothetical protein